MKCAICNKGTTASGTATATLERGNRTLVVKSVPADVCSVCGEEYISQETTRILQAQANEAVAAGVVTEVRDFRAA